MLIAVYCTCTAWPWTSRHWNASKCREQLRVTSTKPLILRMRPKS